MAQSGKHLTLDLSSSPDLGIMSSSPELGSMLGVEGTLKKLRKIHVWTEDKIFFSP